MPNIRILNKDGLKELSNEIMSWELQAWTGLEGYRRLRLPDCMTVGT